MHSFLHFHNYVLLFIIYILCLGSCFPETSHVKLLATVVCFLPQASEMTCIMAVGFCCVEVL